MESLISRAAQYVNTVRKRETNQIELLGHILQFAAREIESAEQKAFAAGRELHPTNFAERKYQTFDQWKEENK